jgi:hypothetical protein
MFSHNKKSQIGKRDSMEIINTILKQMSNISKPQQKFLIVLLTTLMLLRGRVNFRNLSRYSDLCEKTYSRQFRKPFDFVEFNRLGVSATIPRSHTQIGAIDCSFINKSGNHTYGLGKFYDSKSDKAAKGLEISTISIVDVDYNTAYTISTRQTPVIDDPNKTRMDWYLEHLEQDRYALWPTICYLAHDGFYQKVKFIDGVIALGLHSVGKLRCDANLRYLYHGPQKPCGRPKRYNGKVRFNDLSRFELAAIDGKQRVYTAVVNSVSLKRDIRIAYIVKQDGNRISTALLFCTDINLPATEIYRYYKARFQIEFLFRDAKQFTGLLDCQARCEQSLHFHFNASMTALNLLKMHDRQLTENSEGKVISILSWKIKKFNEHFIEHIFSMLELDLSLIKSNPQYEDILKYGTIDGC